MVLSPLCEEHLKCINGSFAFSSSKIYLYCIITDCQIISIGNAVPEIVEYYIVKCNKHLPDKLDLF